MTIVILAVAVIIIICILPDKKSSPNSGEDTVKPRKSGHNSFSDDETVKGISAADKAYMHLKFRKK